jgi:hypothetical protein
MYWYKGISNFILGVLGMLGASNVLAAIDWDHTLIPGETEVIVHKYMPSSDYSALFTDTDRLKLNGAGSVNVSIFNGQLLQHSPEVITCCLSVSDLIMKDDGSNTPYSTGDRHGLFDETVGSVPLPAAVWLFGTALVGFVVFNARRSV